MKTIITTSVSFDAAHRLYKYDGACSNLHGHTYTIEASVESGAFNTREFTDAKDLKRCLKNISNVFDHGLILNVKDKLYTKANIKTKVTRLLGNPTIEKLSNIVYIILVIQGFILSRVSISETPTSKASVSWNNKDHILLEICEDAYEESLKGKDKICKILAMKTKKMEERKQIATLKFCEDYEDARDIIEKILEKREEF